jgi:uncharacterized membrane protein SirB2
MSQMGAFAVFSSLLLAFLLAGVLELRQDRQSLRSFVRILPLVVAVLLSVSLLADIYRPYLSFEFHFSRTMSALSIFVAISSLVCRYKSRPAATLMFIGGLALALFWSLNRWVT